MTRRKPSAAALAAGVNLSRANPSSVRENSADIFCDSLGLGDKICSTHHKEFDREIKRSNERGEFATDFYGKFDGELFKSAAKNIKFKNEASAKILGALQAKFSLIASLKREPFLLKKLTKQAVRTAKQALQEVKFSGSASSKIAARAAKNSGMLAKFNANLLQNRQARRLILSKFDEIFKKSATNICVEFCKFVKSSARQIRLFPSSKLYLGVKARNAQKSRNQKLARANVANLPKCTDEKASLRNPKFQNKKSARFFTKNAANGFLFLAFTAPSHLLVKFRQNSARQIRLFLSAKPNLTAAKADENQNAKLNQSTDKALKIVQTPSVEPSKAAFANLLKYAKTNVLNLPKRQTHAKTSRVNLTRSERFKTYIKFSFKFNRKALK